MENPNPSSPATEVRRCARCGQATLICTRDWQHQILGLPTETRTFDLQCQSCGVQVTLHPHKKIAAERLIAYLMLPAIIPSVIFFTSARRKARAWTDNPVVDGAHRSPAVPNGRMCDCGRIAACVRIVKNRTSGGISLSTRYEYRCHGCGRAFSVRDVAGIAFFFVSAVALSAAGAVIIAFPPGSDVGAETSNQWFGVGLAVVALMVWLAVASMIQSRMRHPEIGSPL